MSRNPVSLDLHNRIRTIRTNHHNSTNLLGPRTGPLRCIRGLIAILSIDVDRELLGARKAAGSRQRVVASLWTVDLQERQLLAPAAGWGTALWLAASEDAEKPLPTGFCDFPLSPLLPLSFPLPLPPK